MDDDLDVYKLILETRSSTRSSTTWWRLECDSRLQSLVESSGLRIGPRIKQNHR